MGRMMRKFKAGRTTAVLLTVIVGLSSTAAAAQDDSVVEGKDLSFDRTKGNCLACHVIAGGTLMGSTAPPLVQMKARFPERKKLYEQVWDARARNPQTFMPPFGAHGILSPAEVDKVVDFIYTL